MKDRTERAKTIVDLLQDLATRGVTLRLNGERLIVDGPAAALDAALLAEMRAARGDLIAILSTDRAVDSRPPAVMTQAQAALLPIARMYRGDARHHVPLAVEMEGEVDLFRLIEAWNIVQDRHDALRQCFPDGQERPILRPRGARLGLDADLHLDPAGIDDAIAQFVRQPFDLAQGPLWRAMAIHTDHSRVILVWVFHHLVFDGASRDVFLRELAVVDCELALGLSPERGTHAWQVADLAEWEDAHATPQRLKSAQEWWRGHLAQAPAGTALPPAPPRSGVATPGSLAFNLSPDVIRSLRSSARAAGVPVAGIAISAVAQVLGAVIGQDRVIVATPVMNRDHPKAAGTIGYLNRILPLVVSTAAGNAVQVGRCLLAANDHRHLPGAELTALVGLPLNRLMVSWQERPTLPTLQRHLPCLRHVAREAADFDLAVQFEAQGDAVTCRIDWAPGTLGDTAAVRFAGMLQDVLVGAVLAEGPDAAALVAAVQTDRAVMAAAMQTDRRTGISTVWLELDEFYQTAPDALMDAMSRTGHGILPAARFVTCAALPRRADGTPDTDSLVAQPSYRLQVTALPEPGLETAIAAIWQRLLMTDDHVGRDDDFRSLGGHSLLAVRMLAEVMALTGRDRLSAAMASAQTVRALALAIDAPEDSAPIGGLDPAIVAGLRSYTAVWRGSRHAEGALTIGRNGSGDRHPLFWCLQSERELDALALHLGADQPVFGMRSGYQVMVKSPQNIDRLAVLYAAEIAVIHPCGPLFLGGNCQAAVIAFDIARHLRASGRTVDLLILHEKMVAQHYDGRIALSFGRDGDRNPFLADTNPVAEFRRYYTGEMSLDLVAGSHGQYFQEPFVLDLVGTIKRLRDAMPTLRKE